MPQFIVVRHGSNAANQHMRMRKVLGTVEAANQWTCYNNQRFEVIDLAGRTRKADREEASEQDALRQ